VQKFLSPFLNFDAKFTFDCKIFKMAALSSPKYKLTYFARGVAEATRFIFAYAGVAYEDNRVSREEWPSLKAETPFGQLPFLEVDGQKIGQSAAFTRMLARTYGLAGKDDIEQSLVDAIVDFQKGQEEQRQSS
jgi:glutathione S-transferase